MDSTPKINVLTDADVAALPMRMAVECMEDAFREHARGRLIAPGRLVSDVDVGQLVFTVGAAATDQPVVGFRFYDMTQLHSPSRAEMTAVFSATDGSLRGLVTGPLLGAVRTGAIGGVAVKYLACADVQTLGLIGAGFQARTQFRAATEVRRFTNIQVFSRDADRRNQFVAEFSNDVDADIQPVDSAREAVEDADVLICTTTSPDPVVEAAWLKPGAHINAVGPKFRDRTELGMDVYERAARLVTDAPAQVEATGDAFILHGTPLLDSLEPLSKLVAAREVNVPANAEATAAQATTNDTNHERRPDAITLFVSLGLAGTEVFLANRLFDASGPD